MGLILETMDITFAYLERKVEGESWGSASNFLILSCIKFLQVMRLDELGKEMLSYADEKEEWQREQDTSYRYPCHTETHQEINKLEECKYCYVFERHQLHKGSMYPFQDPAKMFK